ncbi:MAG: hypothetical protein DWQ31_21550 [Planctomycetota bacterium]|nr:MAG: hypothetical protein DWQ31_21550 [Planctomycetota bacterium]REJ93690.1 MAG: hypothetical protein DWQ35_10085 [Planctomycetota bacterium]
MMSQFVHSLRPVRRCVIAGLGLTILLAALAAAEAADWRSWRGPENKGVTLEADLPLSWGTTENVAWRVDLPDRGNSTPIVVGDLVIVTQSVEETKRREVIAFDAENGTERWRSGIRYEESEASHRDNPFCAPSPVSDGERVYVWFGSAGFYCYDLGGRELWKRDLGKQQHMWGYAASPVLYKDLCILSFGPGVREFLIAMDKRSGDTVWKHEGLTDAEEAEITIEGTNGNAGRRGREETETDEESGSLPRADAQRGAWGTPIVVRHAGRDELVVSYPRRLVSYDPASGDEIWTCRGLGPLVYSSPIAGDGV